MAFKDLDDIEREKRLEAKEKMKKELGQDAAEMVDTILTNVEDTFKRKKIEREKKRPWYKKLIALLGVLFLLILIVDLLLGSVWVLRFFIKSLFHI